MVERNRALGYGLAVLLFPGRAAEFNLICWEACSASWKIQQSTQQQMPGSNVLTGFYTAAIW